MSTILTSTGITFPDNTTQSNLSTPNSGYPMLRMFYWGGGGTWYPGTTYTTWTPFSITNYADTRLPFNAASMDTAGGARAYSPQYDYVIQKNGYYYISVDYTIQSSVWIEYARIAYSKNGTWVEGTQWGSISIEGVLSRYSAKFSDIISANVGDYIQGRVYAQTTQGSLSVLYCNLQLNYLRPL
jgi:hypothetical protein